jgi:hypothetical protein
LLLFISLTSQSHSRNPECSVLLSQNDYVDDDDDDDDDDVDDDDDGDDVDDDDDDNNNNYDNNSMLIYLRADLTAQGLL